MEYISAADIKKLHEKTGCRILVCKKALEMTNGNLEEAEMYLKENFKLTLDLMVMKYSSRYWNESACKIIYEKYNGIYELECIFIDSKEIIEGASLEIDLDKGCIKLSFPNQGRMFSKILDFRNSIIAFEEDNKGDLVKLKISGIGTVIIEDNVDYNVCIMLLQYGNYLIENGLYENSYPFAGMVPIEDVECYDAQNIFREYFEGTEIKRCELGQSNVTEFDSFNKEIDSNYSNIYLGFTCGDYRNKRVASYKDLCVKNKDLQFELDVVGYMKYSLSASIGDGLKVLVDDEKMKILVSNDPDYCDGRMIEFYHKDEYEIARAYFWVAILYEEKIKTQYVYESNNSNGESEKSDVEIESPDNELNQLIGMKDLKNDVRNLVNFMKMQQTRREKGFKTVPVSLHLVFTGNPGTGKTTVARILAQIYKQLGILSKGQLVEVDRASLVAGYVGQTAIKTQEKIDEAKGGILFIDEAYTLAKEGNDYGQEAIDTILKAMEDNRENFIVIVAGYPDLMENFINSNPGLKSRFNKYFYFEDYSCDELEQIFKLMCQKYDYIIEPTAEEVIKAKIYEMVTNKDKNFANARDIRNYFETIISNQASRVMMISECDSQDMITITKQDVL